MRYPWYKILELLTKGGEAEEADMESIRLGWQLVQIFTRQPCASRLLVKHSIKAKTQGGQYTSVVRCFVHAFPSFSRQ